MYKSVKIPIVEKKRPIGIRIISYTTMLLFILFIAALIIVEDNKIIGITLLISIAILFIITLLLKKGYNIEGILILNPKEIKIQTKKNNTFNINELDKIEFFYRGYQGKMDIINATSYSGLDNEILFVKGEDKKRFELLLKKEHLASLNYFFDKWKSQGKDIRIKNLWNKEMTKLS